MISDGTNLLEQQQLGRELIGRLSQVKQLGRKLIGRLSQAVGRSASLSRRRSSFILETKLFSKIGRAHV